MKLRYVSLAESSGYGLSAQAYLRMLLRAGVEVEWLPLVATSQGYLPWQRVEGGDSWMEGLAERNAGSGDFSPEILDTIDRGLEPDLIFVQTIPELWPQHLDSERTSLGMTVWETDALPPHWPDLINRADRVVVPCHWNVEVFADSGIVRPMEVLPHALSPRGPAPAEDRVASFRQDLGIAEGAFVFYSIDTWNARKAPWWLIRAFQRAFENDRDVCLVLKTSLVGPRSGADPDLHPTRQLVEELVSSFENPVPTIVLDQELPAAAIDLLHRLGDCFLSLSHCEGWGLGAFEAAALGNPVIMTGWGGQLDFLTGEWPYLIDYELTPVMNAHGRMSYLPNQRWAAASIEHAIELMRGVREDPEEARRRCQPHARRIRRDFDEARIGERLLEVLSGAG